MDIHMIHLHDRKKQLFHINNQKKYKKQKDSNIIHKENIGVCVKVWSCEERSGKKF